MWDWRQTEVDANRAYGLTVTPSAQSLCVGSRPLSGGGWKAPPAECSMKDELEGGGSYNKESRWYTELHCWLLLSPRQQVQDLYAREDGNGQTIWHGDEINWRARDKTSTNLIGGVTKPLRSTTGHDRTPNCMKFEEQTTNVISCDNREFSVGEYEPAKQSVLPQWQWMLNSFPVIGTFECSKLNWSLWVLPYYNIWQLYLRECSELQLRISHSVEYYIPRVLGKVFSNSLARSGSFSSGFMSEMTF